MDETNYQIEGNGEVVVLIHGLSDSLDYWLALSSFLKNNYRVLRYDLRGHGKTPVGSDEITVDLYAEDLKNLLDDLNIKKANLVGFSLGGAIALEFSIKYPSYVSSMVLMSSYFNASKTKENFYEQIIQSIDDSYDKFYDYMMPLILCPDVIGENKEELEILKQLSVLTANVEGIKKASIACSNFDVEDKLNEIDIPTLILAGRYDEIYPVEIQKELNSKIKNSELIIIDNVKHNLLVGKNIKKISVILSDFFK